jgi:hypothetical protein
MLNTKWQKAILDYAEAESLRSLKLTILRVEVACLRMRMATAQSVLERANAEEAAAA